MDTKNNRPPRDKSLVNRIIVLFLFWITVSNAVALLGLWWLSHYLIEQNLRKEVVQLLPEFDNRGIALYFSNSDEALRLINEYAKRIKDISYIRYYDANLKLIGQYQKQPAAELPAITPELQRNLDLPQDEPLILAERTLGIIRSIRALAPIRSKALKAEAMLDLNLKPPHQETVKTIGYLDIGMDPSPSRDVVINGVIYGLFILGTLLGVSLMIGWTRIRNALKPLVSLQSTLKRVAAGDFDVTVENQSTDREIAAISNAIRTTIAGLLQRDLEKEEALRAKFTAEAANEAKSLFLANMSHEIRTPLHGLLGFLNLLTRTPLNKEQSEYLKTVNTSAKTLLAIINDILDFSKIEAGKLSLEEIEMDLQETFEETAGLHAATAENKGLELAITYTAEPNLMVLGDPARIMQILSNLISNAIKFTDRGAVIVRLCVEKNTETDVTVNFSVRDTGIGISNEVIERLFQPFTQADSSTTRKYGGTGLGLVIVKRILEIMGSRIQIESSPGKGSCFSFSLTFKKAKAQLIPYPMDKLPPLRITLVVASTWLKRSLQENLAAWEKSLRIASNVEQVLTLLTEDIHSHNAIDIIIADANVPCAVQLPQLIKQMKVTSKLHFILLGNLYTQINPAEMLTKGFHGYITKPVKSSDLYRELRSSWIAAENDNVITPLIQQKHPLFTERTNFRALIVDDNEINRRLAGLLLEKIGGIADYAANGEAAVEAYKQNRYDIILMDVYMPGMDGVEATRQIRNLESTSGSHTPVIALTASPLSGDRQRFIAAGVDGYLTKPITEKTLLTALAQWCEDKSQIKHRSFMAATPVIYETTAMPIVDPHKGVETAFGRPDAWLTVLTMLMQDLPNITHNIRSAHLQQDFLQLQQCAHKLSGAASCCGTSALEQAAKTLEIHCQHGEQIQISHSVALVIQEAEKLTTLYTMGQLPKPGEAAVY